MIPPQRNSIAERLLADDPATASSGCPLLTNGAQLYCGRIHSDGRREIWDISSKNSVTTITGYQQGDRIGTWERQQMTAVGLDLVAALHQLTDLLRLSPEVITRFEIGPNGPAPEMLIEAMTVVDGEASNAEWPDTIDVPWDDDLNIDDFFQTIEWRHIWAMIDDLRITALRTVVDSQDVVVPVLMDLDPSDAPEWHAVEVISQSSWVNDDTGAPVSWQGWNSVLRLNRRVAVASQRGDDGREDRLFILPADLS